MRFDPPKAERQDSGIGESYWLDLRMIREAKGIEIDTVHERTRVPIEILSKFERRGFPDRKRFNSVYRRSMVAAYARAIEINPDDVLRSAEESEIGRYRGRLAKEYLGVETVKATALRFEQKGAEIGLEMAGDRERSAKLDEGDGLRAKTEDAADAGRSDHKSSSRFWIAAAAILVATVVLWLIVTLI